MPLAVVQAVVQVQLAGVIRRRRVSCRCSCDGGAAFGAVAGVCAE